MVTASYAQTGTVTGVVTEKPAVGLPGPVVGAVVKVDSIAAGAQTDFDGKYSIRIAPGTYSITCKFFGYSPVTISGVKVEAGKSTPLDFVLDASKNNLDSGATTFTFIDYRPTSTQGAILDTIRKGNAVVDGTGSSEIAKTPVTNAGEVAKRLPGVTLVDNRFVVVRGLSERYNSVLLNSVLAPSVESDVKSFSFDLVPSAMIDNFLIYKSPSPDLPGEFAGGVIRINTTEIPDHSGINVNYQAGFRSGTTMQPIILNKGTSSDAFGFGANSRALPAGFPEDLAKVTSKSTLQQLGREMPDNWTYQTFNAPVDNRFNMTWNYRYSKAGSKDHNGFQFGNITGINYSNTYSSFTSYRLDYNTYSASTHSSDTIFSYEDLVGRQSVRLALVQNNALRFGKAGNQHITFKNLFNQMGDNETSLRTGRNMEEANFHQDYSYHYTQRTIYTGQLGGQHYFNNKRTQFDWTAAYSLSRRQDPDWKRVHYYKDFSAQADDPFYVYVTSAPTPSFMGRIYMWLVEDIKAANANFQQIVTLGKDSNAYSFTVKAGVYAEDKERDFRVRNIAYKAASIQTYSNSELLVSPINTLFNTANIDSTNGLQISEKTSLSDQYKASNKLQAGYVMVILPFGHFTGKNDLQPHERVRVSGGLRVEHNDQQLHSHKTNSNDTAIVINNITSFLPSVNIAFNLTDRMVGRVSYGKTLNRPEFREIAPFYFYDFVFNSINTGNENLKIATVDNYDLRWEFYPRSGENITVGLFYKKFINPIEVYFVPGVGSGGTRSFTWGNAPRADNYGAEIEVRKRLDSLNIPVIRNIGIVANAAWIDSRIKLDTVGSTRPMMGQSPWIINAGLFYQNDSLRLQINAMYNVIGPRVVIVGVPGIPEVYEMPRHQLDFAVVKTFGSKNNIDVRLNITDLLNQETLLMQDADGDGKLNRNTDQRMQYFKRGTYYTLGVTVRLPN